MSIASGAQDRTLSGSFRELLDKYAELYGYLESTDLHNSYDERELRVLLEVYVHALASYPNAALMDVLCGGGN